MHKPFATASSDQVRPLRWQEDGLAILDQRRLPDCLEYRFCTRAQEVAEAIQTMQIRGAPAIGIAAAYAVVLAATQHYHENPHDWKKSIQQELDRLAKSRPTAVNLFWALRRMDKKIQTVVGNPRPALLSEARAIHQEDIDANYKMGQLGADLIGKVKGVLTHCNTGSLATGGFGTALGVIRTLWQRSNGGKNPANKNPISPLDLNIFATETRPWLQGARLTLWELEQDRIPATLIADSAAAFLMQQGKIDWVIVGADRITAHGDVANKIGTYSLAAAARQHGIGLMVVAPTSTIDWNLTSAGQIPIEQRDPGELLPSYFRRADSLAKAWNPVFDLTPREWISAIVTERGIAQPPNSETLANLKGDV